MSNTSIFFHKYSQGEVQIHIIHNIQIHNTQIHISQIHKYSQGEVLLWGKEKRNVQLLPVGRSGVKRSFKRLLKLGNEILRTSKDIHFRTHVLDVNFSFPLVLFWDLVNIKWPF